MSYESLIIGGDLNFSIGATKVWGESAREDTLTHYFSSILSENDLIDIEPVKLRNTWRNKRMTPNVIEKRLGRFVILESFVKGPLRIRKWVGFGGDLDHFHIFLKMVGYS